MLRMNNHSFSVHYRIISSEIITKIFSSPYYYILSNELFFTIVISPSNINICKVKYKK